MLTKQAQDNIKSEYYTRGVELALEQIKEAGVKDVIKKMIQLPSVGSGALLGGGGTALGLEALRHYGVIPSMGGSLATYLALAGGGAGAMGAQKASGKVLDLADAGIQKLLKKMKK